MTDAALNVTGPHQVQSLSGIAFGHALREVGEFALIDLRDADAFGNGGPLFGNNVSLADLVSEVPRLIPHRHTLIALVDADGGSVGPAADQLNRLGYTNLIGLKGGLDGNDRLPVLPIRIAGPRAISGEVERSFNTPVITPLQLAAEQASGEPVIVLDSRSIEEYERSHIPGSFPSPGAEILAYFKELVPSPQTHVVVTCAGRSRAVLGVEILRQAGVAKRVSMLDFGTHGWKDEGLPLFEGPEFPLVWPSAGSLSWAAEAATPFSRGLPTIDAATLALWQADASRTTYAIDVRQPHAFAAAHLPNSVSAPGGQLGIFLGKWVAVQGARLVLIDDAAGFRAASTGYWFKRQGWDVSLVLHPFA